MLNKLGVGLEDVRTAIADTNANRPKGAVEDGDRRWQIGANDQAYKAYEYMPIIVAYRNGAPVRLSDFGEVRDSVQDLRNAGSADGKPSVLLIINRQPGANIIETVDRVRALLPQLRASIPAAIDMKVVQDRTPTIRASLKEVGRALVIAFGLVIMVVFLFLRNLRAALIPAVAVPVSLVGTFGVMYLCGFSARQPVADGADRRDRLRRRRRDRRAGERVAAHRARRAAVRGCTERRARGRLHRAVDEPVAHRRVHPDPADGRHRRAAVPRVRRHAVGGDPGVARRVADDDADDVLAAAPKPPPPGGRGRFHRASERVFERIARGYERSLAVALRHGPDRDARAARDRRLNVYLYITIPKGFFPQQDTGRVIGFVQADQGISFQAMRREARELRRDRARRSGGRERRRVHRRRAAQLGLDVRRAEAAARSASSTADQVIARLRGKLAHEPGANLFLVPVQDIRIGGRQANAQYQYTLQADDLAELRAWEPKIRAAMAELPELVDVNTDQQDKGQQTSLVIDRDAASRLGVTARMIDTTLNDAFGQRQVSTIYNPLNQYRVVMEVAPEYWQSPDALQRRPREDCGRRAGPVVGVRHLRPDVDAARGQPPGPVRSVDDLVQPSGRRLAVRGHCGDRRHDDAPRRADVGARHVRRRRARVPADARRRIRC